MINILVIRYSGLGDIVMLLPTLEQIKIKYPNSKITLLCDYANQDIYPLSCGLIDDVVTINRNYFRKKEILKSLIEIKNLFQGIWNKFDIVYDFQSFGETAIISWLSRAKIRIGSTKKEKYNKYYTVLRPYVLDKHRSVTFSTIADVKLDKKPKLCVSEESRYKKQIDNSKKVMGLNIGSSQDSRRWSEESFNELARAYKDRYNILVFFGPSEKIYLQSFDDEFIKIYDCNLQQLASAIKLCDIFISNDTGPVHIAAALGVPTITLFSTGVDWQVGCLNDKKEYIQKDNINEITIDEVAKLINKIG